MTRMLWKRDIGRVWWRIGAVNALWEGGLRQMSVDGGAVIVKASWGLKGGGAVLLVYLYVIVDGARIWVRM